MRDPSLPFKAAVSALVLSVCIVTEKAKGQQANFVIGACGSLAHLKEHSASLSEWVDQLIEELPGE
jgi:hypothetical protein